MKKKILDNIYEIINDKGPTSFDNLWKEIEQKEEFAPLTFKDKAKIFTIMNLKMDFILIEDNLWDLRNKNKYDKAHIPINKIYNESSE